MKNYIIKAIAAVLALAFVLNIAACSNSTTAADTTSSLVSETDVAAVESDDTEEVELTAAHFDAVEASSYANWDGTVGYPEWAFDGDTATAWQDGIQATTDNANEYGVGEWLKLYNSDGDTGYLNSVTICNGYQDDSNNTGTKDYYELNSRVKGFSLTFDDGSSLECELEDVKDAQNFSFEAVETSSVTFTILSVYEGKWSDTCIAEVSYNLDDETIITSLEATGDDDTTSTTATAAKVGATTTTKKSSTTTTTTKATTTTAAQNKTAVEIDLGDGESTTIYVTYYQSSAKSMLSMINEWRTTDGGVWYYAYKDAGIVYAENLQALTWDSELEKEAKLRAAELAVKYSHTRPNGTKSAVYTAASGYKASGENIADTGSSNASNCFNGWKEENATSYSGQGHRRTMLSSSLTRIGIACAYYNGRYYWAMELSR